jgi:hypothetical protein
MAALLPIWAATGTVVQPDNTKISVGWLIGEKPPHEYMNWWMLLVTQRLNHLLQSGINEWSADTTFGAQDYTKHNGVLYRALVSNTNNEPNESPTQWIRVSENASNLTVGTVPSARLNGAYTNITNLTASGIVTAGSFVGAGANITNLNASSLDQGTVPNARIAGTYTNFVAIQASGAITAGLFSGNGGSLTNLNAAQLAAGAIPNARLTGHFNQVNSLTTVSGTVIAGGVSTPGAISAGTTINAVGNITTSEGRFNGSGAGLTELNAGNLSAGAVPNGRISGTYTGFVNITASGTINAGGNVNGVDLSASGLFVATAGDGPKYVFAGAAGTGMGRPADGMVSLYAANAELLRVNGVTGHVSLIGTGAYYGKGSGLTLLPAGQLTGTVPVGALPQEDAAEATRIRGHLAIMSIGQIGTTANLLYTGPSTIRGQNRTGDSSGRLYYASSEGDTDTAASNEAAGTWKCLGRTANPGIGAGSRTTLWRRVS